MLKEKKALKKGTVGQTPTKTQTTEKPQINHHIFGVMAHGGKPMALKNSTKKGTKDNLNPARKSLYIESTGLGKDCMLDLSRARFLIQNSREFGTCFAVFLIELPEFRTE